MTKVNNARENHILICLLSQKSFFFSNQRVRRGLNECHLIVEIVFVSSEKALVQCPSS